MDITSHNRPINPPSRCVLLFLAEFRVNGNGRIGFGSFLISVVFLALRSETGYYAPHNRKVFKTATAPVMPLYGKEAPPDEKNFTFTQPHNTISDRSVNNSE